MLQKKPPHMHHGHRKRVFENFLSGAAFSDIQLLEMMLFFCISRSDTNDIAHELLDRFGSIEGVLAADEKEITQINGMGISSTRKLKRISEFSDAYTRLSTARQSGDGWTYVGICTYLSNVIAKKNREAVSPKRYGIVGFSGARKADCFLTFDNYSEEFVRDLIKRIPDGGNKKILLCIFVSEITKDDQKSTKIRKLQAERLGIDAIAYIAPYGLLRLYKVDGDM